MHEDNADKLRFYWLDRQLFSMYGPYPCYDKWMVRAWVAVAVVIVAVVMIAWRVTP